MKEQVSFYINAKDNKGSAITIQQAIDLTGIGLRDTTFVYRTLEPGTEKDEYKKTKFPAVTWSGLFKKRNARLLHTHSGLICIDIDKLTAEKHDALKKLLRNDAHIYFLFTSPGGNGLKPILKINIQQPHDTDGNTPQDQHLHAFQAIERYFKQEYGVEIDKSGKDVSRLCFLCYDDTAFFNPDAIYFPVSAFSVFAPAIQSIEKKAETFKTTKTKWESLQEQFDFIIKWVDKHEVYEAGISNNNYLYLFSCGANRLGISQIDCENYISSNYNEGNDHGILTTIKSAYKNHINEHGKFAKQSNEKRSGATNQTNGATQKTDKRNNAGGQSTTATNNSSQPRNNGHTVDLPGSDNQSDETEDTPLFWHKTVNDKTGKETIQLKYTNFYNFLETEGFANLKVDNQNVELIHVKENIVTPVIINNTRNDLKQYMNNYCKENNIYAVLEMLHRGQDKYFARKQFVNLGYRTIDFLRDSEDVSYHFHSNCVVECRKDGLRVRDYGKGEKALWASQINPREFKRDQIMLNAAVKIGIEKTALNDLAATLSEHTKRITEDTTDCEFLRYQILASCHPESDVTADVANKRFLAHATSFGFLINNYKPSIGKAIVGVDHHKAIDKSEQNGRTGKGIFSKAIGHVTKRFAVDGRRYDPKDQSVFEGLTMDAKVITVDDCNERFDFGNFFVPVTEDFTVRKMYLGYITLLYELSPKWYFNTNFTFRGDGDSFTGRQHIIEFDNFFNKKYTPIHHFKHSLFRDWNDEEWNRFYNYAYECDCMYKAMDLVDYAGGNYGERKLNNECPEEFIDFVDATDEETGEYLKVKRNSFFDKKAFLKEWSAECMSLNMPAPKAKALYAMMKKYCQTKGTGFFTKKANSEELYWVGNKMPAPLVKTIKEIVAIPADKKENNPVLELDV